MQDMEFQSSQTGKIQIADEVLQIIAGLAASEVPGVAGMSGSFAGGLTEQLLGRKNLSKGVKVEFGEDDKQCSVDVSVVLDFGVNIPDVGLAIQGNVKQAIESMTGLEVTGVHVHVSAVAFNQEKPQDKVKDVMELQPAEHKK